MRRVVCRFLKMGLIILNKMEKGNTYEAAGVNIELGDDVSKVLYNAAKETWANREGKLGELVVACDDFSGTRAVDISGLPDGTLTNMGFDGVGTKVMVAQRVGNHRTVAYDLFAMVCDDAVVRGAEPVLIGSILDVNSLGRKGESYMNEVGQLAEGYIAAAREAGVAVVNGEVAELGASIRGYSELPGLSKRFVQAAKYLLRGEFPESEGFNYNWGAGVVWVGNKDRMFTGKEIRKGDCLVGLREEGFRSNGLSLVRRIMEKTHGRKWHEAPWGDGRSYGDMVLTPSRIYSKAVVDMFGGYNGTPRVELHGVAHITGGGIPGKLGRMLKPSGLGANINNPYAPFNFMFHTQKLGNVADDEAYRTFNMGQGMILATPDPARVIAVASDHGIGAREIGYVTDGSLIRIKNRGAMRDSSELIFKGAA